MPLSPEDVARLDERARQVGTAIGWALGFCEAPYPEYVFLTAGTIDDDFEPVHVTVHGPLNVDAVTVHEVDLLLDQIESGERKIVADEDGDPRLI